MPGFGDEPREWVVIRILAHSGRGTSADFQVQWSNGDVTWLPFSEARHLQALDSYCEAMGIIHPRNLPFVAPNP